MANENPRPVGNPQPYQEPAARAGDLDTSHAAAASVRGTENLRSRLYTLLSTRYPGGLTHEQIIEAYHGYVAAQSWPTATSQGIRSRIKELEREGKVRHDVVASARTTNGRRTHRWYPVTDPDEQALEAARVVAEAQAKAVDAAEDDTAPQEPQELPLGQDSYRPAQNLTHEMAQDLRDSRKADRFTAVEMAQFLVNRGWRK